MPARGVPLILAIDLGTSSVRTALFDAALRRRPGSLAQHAYSVRLGDDGTSELAPETLADALRQCLDHTVPQAGGRGVEAIGFSCFWHGLLGVDKQGRPMTPVYTWADSRCRDAAARLRAETPERAYHARTGCMLRASYWPAKLRWLSQARHLLFRRVAAWRSPAEWLQHQFCEEAFGVTAHGMATGTGLYDPNALGWDAAAVDLCRVRAGQLPTISTGSLRLRGKFRRRYPPLREARWWPAIGDGAAGNLGSGATRPGRAAINVGTSAAFRLMRWGKHASAPFGLFCYRVDPERFVVGGAVSNAGNLRAWCRRELRLPGGSAALEDALAARQKPLSQLVVLPFWSAERAPTWCENLGGVISGLTLNTTALDLFQATTEAVYQRLALIADLALGGNESRPRDARIIVSGGILKSASLLQRLADVLGRSMHRSSEPEASLRGAAVYAAEQEGMATTRGEENRAPEGKAVRPRRGIAALYARERQRQEGLKRVIGPAGKQHSI